MPPGHGGQQERHPLVSVVVTPVTHRISGARQLPLSISCPCQVERKHHWQGLKRLSWAARLLQEEGCL